MQRRYPSPRGIPSEGDKHTAVGKVAIFDLSWKGEFEWLWKAELEGQIFQAYLLNSACTVWHTTMKFGSIKRGERCMGHLRPYRNGAGPSASQFLWFPFIYAYIFWRRTIPNLTWWHVSKWVSKWIYMRRTLSKISQGAECRGVACILGSVTPTIPESRVPALPILGVLLYSCLHNLTQNDQIRHGSTYWEGHVLRSSTSSLYLHKVWLYLSNLSFKLSHYCIGYDCQTSTSFSYVYMLPFHAFQAAETNNLSY